MDKFQGLDRWSRYENNSLYLNTVYRDVAEEGILLYGRREDMQKRGSPIPSYDDLLEIKAEEVECVMEAALSSEKTLGFDGIAPQIGAFHGHKAIQKMLKAWLIALDIRPQRSHVLSDVAETLTKAGIKVPAGTVAFEVSRNMQPSIDMSKKAMKAPSTSKRCGKRFESCVNTLEGKSLTTCRFGICNRAGLQP